MLASIQKIESINPIPNSDNIEVAKVLGWDVVVKKGEFTPGDLCVYIEIDTLIPNKPWFSFLFKGSDIDKEYVRLRTVKLRGQVSQGLALPIFGKENLCTIIGDESDECFNLGRDVSVVLGIKKYEKATPIININGVQTKTRAFPSFIRKTDEVRIQSEPVLLEKLKGKSYYITQKLDGTYATYYKYNNKFGVCSRNLEIPDPRTSKGFIELFKYKFRKLFGLVKREIPDVNVYWKMAFKYDIESWLSNGYAVQGEICGPGIQGNKVGLTENELFIFNIWDIKNQNYISQTDAETLAPSFCDIEYDFGVKFVPIIENNSYTNHLIPFNYSLNELIEKAKGTYENGTPQEGIVVRSVDETISFKVINNDFLLEYGE